MDVTIRLFAGLRERAGSEVLTLAGLPVPLDVAGLKREIEARHPELGSLAGVRGVVGTTYVLDDTPLTGDEELSLLPPVSGGAPPPAHGDTEDSAWTQRLEAGVFEIHADPLDPLDAQRVVTHPSCGAVVLFTGVTRETNRERDVVELDYSAFEEMAGDEMQAIYAECRQRFGADAPGAPGAPDDARAPAERRQRMLTRHRTGIVGVGEPSIVIAVASPHRDAAFLACRFLIDELKARVPLWKKESYSDGHHWVGERS